MPLFNIYQLSTNSLVTISRNLYTKLNSGWEHSLELTCLGSNLGFATYQILALPLTGWRSPCSCCVTIGSNPIQIMQSYDSVSNSVVKDVLWNPLILLKSCIENLFVLIHYSADTKGKNNMRNVIIKEEAVCLIGDFA